MTHDIEILNDIISTHPQFKGKSLLYDGIAKTLNCSLIRAKELAATHCNMISLYAILEASGTDFGAYSDYFRWMLDRKFCKENGYIIAEKSAIMTTLGLTYSDARYTEIEDIHNPIRLNPDKFYQIKIKGNTDGFHFMAGYVEDGVFKLSDTSYRGIGVSATEHITEKNWQWIAEV